MTTVPYPWRPRSEVVKRLRRALTAAREKAKAGEWEAAFWTLEEMVITSVADLEAPDVPTWERMVAELRVGGG